MANGEDDIKRADKKNDAAALVTAYNDYRDSLTAAGQESSIKPLKDILGHK